MTADALKDLAAGALTAFDGGNPEPFIDLFAEDSTMRFVAPAEVFPFAAPHKGPSGARAAIALIGADYQWLSYRPIEMIADTDWVFSLNGGRLRHRPSGREMVMQVADLVRFAGEQIVEFIEFFDSAGVQDWHAGIGLPACTRMNPANKATRVPVDDPQRNKAALGEALTAYRGRDAGPLIALLAEDVSYNSVARRKDFRFAGPCYGRDAFVGCLSVIAEDYALEKYDWIRMLGEEDLVAVHSDVAFRHRKTDKVARTEKIDLFRMRDGQIIEFNEFFDTLTARAAHYPG